MEKENCAWRETLISLRYLLARAAMSVIRETQGMEFVYAKVLIIREPG